MAALSWSRGQGGLSGCLGVLHVFHLEALSRALVLSTVGSTPARLLHHCIGQASALHLGIQQSTGPTFDRSAQVLQARKASLLGSMPRIMSSTCPSQALQVSVWLALHWMGRLASSPHQGSWRQVQALVLCCLTCVMQAAWLNVLHSISKFICSFCSWLLVGSAMCERLGD